jgi:hypothetical protein
MAFREAFGFKANKFNVEKNILYRKEVDYDINAYMLIYVRNDKRKEIIKPL